MIYKDDRGLEDHQNMSEKDPSQTRELKRAD